MKTGTRLAKLRCYWVIIAIILLVGSSSCKRKGRKGGLSYKGKYVNVKTASSKKAPKNVRTVIAAMRDMKGTPHKNGGTSRLGVDCSGLMTIGFAAIGKEIPRRAADQANLGPQVNIADIQPGDMLFFSDAKIGKGITHVGMVTEVIDAGKVQFIHTSSSLGVVESNLYETYWQKTFVKAVRPGF